jgi:glyoxylase I family protein
MQTIHGFHHVAMRVRNIEKSVDFYVNSLGLKKAKEWGEVGNRAIMFDAGNGNYIEVFEGLTEDRGSDQIIHFALRVDNCDQITEQVRAAGATITTEPKDVDIPTNPQYPVRISFFKGPDGEVVELFQER